MTYLLNQHTADFAVTFLANNIDDLFDSFVNFFTKEIIDEFQIDDKISFEGKYEEENISFSLVNLLNDLIYYMEKGLVIEEIKKITFDKRQLKVRFKFFKCKDLSLKIELKAATFHNIHPIDINKSPVRFTVTFDL